MRMPVLFVGHGSPMNILENNKWVRKWRAIGKTINKPKGILMISAHWFTFGTFVTEQKEPELIFDMYGFPKELYEIEYPIKNDIELRDKVMNKLGKLGQLEDSWGYDHGCYSVLYHMYPKADIPVVQMSINSVQNSKYHYELGEKLKELRDEGILIIGSGNVVHNLGLLKPYARYPWADKFDKEVAELINKRDFIGLQNLERSYEGFEQAVPITDHYYPLMVCLGAVSEDETLQIMSRDIVGGSLSMTSYIWGNEKLI